ncbi:MAG TPA: cob(I)yrinic acid a,c-diamide adenosyltransferase [Nitriliruptorales bacterium]|nr:cob(I)yrinic acid a,c-diamide adenosyltransferase [Nitriliruptorales bacterium]
MVKVYTRRGDRGETDLFRGGRVPKDHPRTDAYGTTDELVSALGLARAELAAGSHVLHDAVLEVQRELFAVGGQLATDPQRWDQLEVGVSRVDDAMVEELERRIDAVVEEHPLPKGFVVPGGGRAAAALDLARSICRRAERAVVRLVRADLLPDETVLRYLNRLSDYLYVLARAVEGEHVPSRQR